MNNEKPSIQGKCCLPPLAVAHHSAVSRKGKHRPLDCKMVFPLQAKLKI